MFERRLHEKIEYRDENGAIHVRGYGAVFGVVANLGRFTESISRRAFDGVLDQDVVFVFNHNKSDLLARSSSGTLTYGVNDTGLWYDAIMPDTTLGKDINILIERGDINSNSFAFSDIKDEVSKRNGMLHRNITKIGRLHDISLVTVPAYDAATITRDLDGIEAEYRARQICRSDLFKRFNY